MDASWLITAFFLISASAAALGLVTLLIGLQRTFATAPELDAESTDYGGDPIDTSLTVVIPAFNEAANIEACLRTVLTSASPCQQWKVLVVDDESSDATLAIARAEMSQLECKSSGKNPEGQVIAAGPRPEGERWVGKNWACSQAMHEVSSGWVLFIDADVRLAPDAIRRALHQAIREEADLFSLAPRLVCSCLAEWMVQPIMASLLGLGFPIQETNEPDSSVAFAAGPFMLFRREAYEAIGGHRALAAEVVEDLALARRIKHGGYRLRYRLGLDAVELHMYSSFSALWEGWSKNWFLGLDGSILKALSAGGVVLLMFSTPWLVVPGALVIDRLLPAGPLQTCWQAITVVGLVGIGLQLGLRLWTLKRFALPLKHWWLMGAGGLIVAGLAPTSVWRSLTGQGWTWKGRSLSS